jgi:hypothetical protein
MEINVWAKRGSLRVRTDCLPFDDPDHPYNQIIAQGEIPEDYGFEHPKIALFEKRFGGLSRPQLYQMIVDLEADVLALERHYA